MPDSDASRSRSRFRLLTAALVAAVCLLILEGFLRVVPGVLPAWYRSTFPLAGIELFERGILAATPIDGVPIPYRLGPLGDYRGGPPADLQAMGVVDAADNPDRERYPEIHIHIDRWGLVNPRDVEAADVLLVGDSYARAAGALSPPGLQSFLERRTDLTFFNLGVPAIGPQREAWLLEHVGLTRDPRAVIWFFFGGNDLADAAAVAEHEQNGVRTYADLFPDFIRPRSLLLDLIRKSAGRDREPPPSARSTVPLPAFSLAAGGDRRLWFHPRYLRQLARSRDQLRADPGWLIAARVLNDVAAELARRRIRLLVVYVPSKPQVYLPWVRQDMDLVWRVARFGGATAPGESAEHFWRLAIDHRSQLEALLREHCAARDVDFFSLTEPLVGLARRGELGYLAADSHWNEIGQGVAVEPLARWLKAPRGVSLGPLPIANGPLLAPGVRNLGSAG